MPTKAQIAAAARTRELEARVTELERERNAAINHAGEMEKRAANEVEEHNRTRGLLMAAELSYAKLRGYVEGLEDSAPPRMIPEPRESALARMPDASQGTGGSGSAYYEATAGYQSYGRRDERKPWYYR